MNATEIIWKDSISSNTEVKELGKCFELFAGNKMFVPKKKDASNRQVIMFKTEAGQVASVIMSTDVDEMFTLKKLSLAQALSLNVIKFKGTGHDEESMWLVKPSSGWVDMVATEQVIDWEKLATL